MTNTEILETSLRNVGTADSDDNVDKLTVQTFYSPLCMTGYLTPLQRKKLREKRNNPLVDLNDMKEVKKPCMVKRKKEIDAVVRDKIKERVKKIRTKDSVQQVQCSASKVLHKTTDNIKTNKFFKSSSSDRLEKANFTMPLVLKKNAFLNINKCVKETLSCTRRKNIQKNHISSSVIQNSEVSSMMNSCITQDEQNNSIFQFNWPTDDELLKRQEKAREILREKNVLRKANNLQEYKDVENENNEVNIEANQVKLYPIFHTAIRKRFQSNEVIKSNKKNVNKRMKGSIKVGEQMIIDAGQKDIGAKICSTCNMIYTVSQEEDEKLHLNYHNMYLLNLKFPGWKEENVIGEYCDGRVIMIRQTDKNIKLKKVEDILQVANRDLGFSSSVLPVKPDLTFVLFITNDKQVAGCLIAESISKAFRVLLAGNKSTSYNTSQEKVWRIGNWYSSSEAYPAICGVNRIWVAHSFRRNKVASRMVDSLRCHFIHGHVVGVHELAFTDPSPDGREFAAAYTGTDNFLVYK